MKRDIIRKNEIQIMWKLLQDKPNQSWRNLEEAKAEKKSTNQEEIGKRLMIFCRRQQDGSVDSVRQESQLYIAEDNKDADGSVESIVYCRRQ